MQKVFNIFESDIDGSITIEDVQNVMNSLQFLQNEIELPSLDQIKIAFEKFDENSKLIFKTCQRNDFQFDYVTFLSLFFSSQSL
jgi:Ca2+-binding EF-hand superfamily protein